MAFGGYKANEQIDVDRRRARAKMLMEQGKPDTGTEIVSGYAVQKSPLEGLAKALQSGYGSYEATQADSQQAEINQRKADLLRQAGKAYAGGDSSAAAAMLFEDPAYAAQGISIMSEQNKAKAAAEADALKYQRDLAKEEARNQNRLDVAQMRAGGDNYGQVKLSAAQQKELYDTMDLVNASGSSKSVLQQAQAMNDGTSGSAKPFSGFGAETLAYANRIPLIGALINDERATATTDYGNLVSQQALGSLKEVFGGNPTEGERKILLQLQALPSYTQAEQKVILENAQAAADRRLQYNQTKSQAIQTGDYSGMINPQQNQAPTAPQGGKLIGTSGGKSVYQLPDGTHVMEQ